VGRGKRRSKKHPPVGGILHQSRFAHSKKGEKGEEAEKKGEGGGNPEKKGTNFKVVSAPKQAGWVFIKSRGGGGGKGHGGRGKGEGSKRTRLKKEGPDSKRFCGHSKDPEQGGKPGMKRELRKQGTHGGAW